MPQNTELSILLIEDEPDAARLVQHVFSRRGGESATVEWVTDLGAALSRLGEKQFQAILLDLNLPDSDGYDTFARVRQAATEPAIVVLTGQEDEALALRAVRGGAEDYLLKSDIRERFLTQRVRHAVERNRLKHRNPCFPVRNGKILSFAGAQGGAGTTTLVINAAAALADAGETVIAIELAPECSSFSIQLNRSAAWDISSLLRAPGQISREAVASCLEDFGGGFQVLCAPRRGEDAASLAPEHVRALLGVTRTLADYTLVDISSLSTPAGMEASRCSSLTALVLESNRIGLQSALNRLPALLDTAAPGAVAAVINHKTPSTGFLTPSELGERLGCEVLAVIPPAAELNTMEFEPLPVLSRPESAFSHSIREMASRLKAGTPCLLRA